ncbi:MAG: hypothetical protein OHK0038_17300 [Flammeovirgaceae bacterium]
MKFFTYHIFKFEQGKVILFLLLTLFLMISLTSFVEKITKVKGEIHIEKQVFNKSNMIDEYEMNISYPKIKYTHTEINHIVNVDIQRIMILAITDFTEKVKKNRETEINSEGFSLLTLDYKVYFQKADLLSIKFTKQTLLSGNEKPNNVILTYNFDLRSGKLLKISDIFLPNTEYEKYITTLAKKHSDKCKFKTEYILTNYCFSSEGLILSFDDISNLSKYCHSEIVIPWHELKNIIREDGVFSIFR